MAAVNAPVFRYFGPLRPPPAREYCDEQASAQEQRAHTRNRYAVRVRRPYELQRRAAWCAYYSKWFGTGAAQAVTWHGRGFIAILTYSGHKFNTISCQNLNPTHFRVLALLFL